MDNTMKVNIQEMNSGFGSIWITDVACIDSWTFVENNKNSTVISHDQKYY